MPVILKALLTIESGVILAVVWLGLQIDSAESAALHVNTGIFAAIFTIFIHCLVLFYLNGTARAIKEAVRGHPDLAPEALALTKELRRRAYPPATAALLAVLVAAYAGGWAHGDLIGEYGARVRLATSWIEADAARREAESASGFAKLSQAERSALEGIRPLEFSSDTAYKKVVASKLRFPVRDFPFWWAHLALLAPAFWINIRAFGIEAGLIRRNSEGVRRLNALLAARDAAAATAAGAGRRGG